MPLFTFKCSVCDKETEELVKLNVSEITCSCGEKAAKMVGAPHIDKYSMQKFMRGARGDNF